MPSGKFPKEKGNPRSSNIQDHCFPTTVWKKQMLLSGRKYDDGHDNEWLGQALRVEQINYTIGHTGSLFIRIDNDMDVGCPSLPSQLLLEYGQDTDPL